MADFQTIFDQVYGTSVSGTKRVDVERAAQSKKIEMGAPTAPTDQDLYNTQAGIMSDKGFYSSDQYEADSRTMTPLELTMKYGDGYLNNNVRSVVQRNQYRNDREATRTNDQLLGDTINSVTTGFINSTAGIAAWGAGALGSKAGVAASRGIQRLNEVAQAAQSDPLNAQRRANAAENYLDKRDNQKQYEADIKENGEFVAGAQRIGRNILTTGGNALSNGAIAADVGTSGIGSLLAAGPITSALKSIGRGVLSGASRAGATSAMLARATLAGREAAVPVSIGLMEGGGAYQQTAAEMYDRLKDRTDLSEEQKVDMANQAGQEAAAIQAPLSMASGSLVAKFEANPFAVPSLRTGLRNIAKETVEEGIQSATGQAAQNYGLNDPLDTDVGEQIALGAIGGALAAGTTQAPGIAGQTIVSTAKAPFKAVGKILTARGERILAANQNEQDAILEQAEPIQPTEGGSQYNTVPNGDGFNITRTTGDTVQILNKDGSWVSPETGENTLFADNADAIAAFDKADERQSLNDKIAEQTQRITTDSVKDKIGAATRLFTKFGSQINERLKNLVTADKPTEAQISDAQENTPAFVEMATSAPEMVDPEVAGNILRMADSGLINLTPQQRNAVRGASALVRGQLEYNQKSELYQLPNANKVSEEILVAKTDAPIVRKSAKAHMQGIVEAYNTDDTDTATGRLNDMRLFVEHMQNKVAALNEAIATGANSSTKGIKYQALSEARNWFTAPNGLFVSPTSEASVRQAQQIYMDAEAVASVFNNLADTFSELGVSRFETIPLDPSLDGLAKDIVSENKNQIRTGPLDSVDQNKNPVDQLAEPELDQTNQSNNEKSVDQKTDEVSESSPVQASEEAPVQQEVSQETGDTNDTVLEVVQEAEVSPVPAEDVSETKTADAVFENPDRQTKIDRPYSNLLGSKKNLFRRAFRLPKGETPKSRLTAAGEVLTTIKQALSSENNLINFIGRKLSRNFSTDIAEGYSEYLKTGDKLLEKLNQQLQDFLNENYDKSTSMRDHVLNDGSMVQALRGLALNITEQDADGNIQYNQELIEGAVVAALNWFIRPTTSSYRITDKAAAATLGIPLDEVTDSLRQSLEVGLAPTEMVRTLAQTINRFWGLQVDPSKPRNWAKGITEALAKNIINTMIDENMIGVIEVDITDIDERDKILRYVIDPNNSLENNAILKFPNALEVASLTEPEEDTYIGTPPTRVADNQLRSDTPLTEEQKKVAAVEQNVPYKINTPFIDLLFDMGEDAAMFLFGGGGSTEGRILNNEHKKTLDGQNRTVQSAYRTLFNIVNQLNTFEGNPEDISIYYDHNFTSVNRLQMLGKDNPQSNKLMREAILSTWKTMDLTNADQRELFDMAMAQALGVKVHKFNREDAIKSLNEKFAGMQQTLDILKNFNADQGITRNQLEVVKQELGTPTPLMINVLMEYNRLQETTPEQKQAFRTPIYFEADGVTNGVINAMMLFPAGEFTSDWVSNVARGGVNFYEGQKTLADHLATGGDNKNDLYTVAANGTAKYSNGLARAYQGTPVGQRIKDVNRLLSLLIKDIKFDGNTLILDRGATKNPLTITLYGSGKAGIAGNIADALISSLYEKMSDAAQRLENNPELTFAEAMNMSEEGFTDLKKLLGDLTTSELRSYEENLYIKKLGHGAPKGSFIEYSVDRKSYKALQGNILHAFIEPMTNAITDTVGEPLINSTKVMQQMGQAWSLYAKFVYQQRWNTRLEEKRASNELGKNDVLSQNDENEIKKSMGNLIPNVASGTQNWNLGDSESVDIEQEFGRSFAGNIRTRGQFRGPSDAGVSTIPFLTIGAGDGQMIQNVFQDPDLPAEHTGIFDGIHSTAADLDTMGRIANKGAYDSWLNNPFKNLTDGFGNFLSSIDEQGFTLEERAQLVKALFPTNMWKSDQTEAQIITQMNALLAKANIISEQIDARHEVLKEVAVSIDQMAGAGKPYVKNGIALTGSPSEIATALTQIYRTKLANESNTNQEVIPEQTQEVETMNGTDFESVIKKLKTDRQTKSLLRDVIRSMRVDGWKLFNLTQEELVDKLVQFGDTGLGTVQGFTVPNLKEIYVLNGASETILHELIHAATYERLVSYYSGSNISPDAKQAIVRIEKLMEQFRNLDMIDASVEAIEAHQNALDEMERQRSNMDQDESVRRAGELNEFMAWSLANADLAELLKGTKVENPLVRLGRAVVRQIKQMLWGTKRSAAVKDDVFTNLRFNTNILMRSGNNVSQALSQNILFQQTNYGTDQRLTDLNERIQRKIVDNISADPLVRKVQEAQARAQLVTAHRITNIFNANGFPMRMQEYVTFSKLVQIMSTNMDLDPNASARIQELYRHVVKNLKAETFRTNEDPNDQNDVYRANQRFNLITGAFNTTQDQLKRSSLLPGFLALAMTSKDFRDILNKLVVPKADQRNADSLDNIFDNIGDNFMDNMSRIMSGEGKAANINQALDNLTDSLLDTEEDNTLFIEKFTSPFGNALDRANQVISDLLTRLAQGAFNYQEHLKVEGANPVKQAMANIAATVTSIFDEHTAAQSSMNLIDVANRSQMPRVLHELLNDLIGRTETNKNIYDMIKIARSWSQQIRQQYREKLPKILAKQFSRPVTEQEWTNMFSGLGGTDIAALTGSMNVDQIMDIISDPTKLDLELNKLEDQIREFDPRNNAKYLRKAKQLANYMNTKIPGVNLLRNAEAISNLFNEGTNNLAPTPDLVKAIDQLVTLYAYKGSNQTTKKSLSSLVQNERNGLKFVISYLVGQRTSEMTKTTGNAKFNHYKGHVPSLNGDAVSLMVAPMTERARLVGLGYVEVNGYQGSAKDPTRGQRAYFYAPVSGRAPFAQGIMQNVQTTAYGVDQVTGFTTGLTAGTITDPLLVRRLYNSRTNEIDNEALMPLYNDNGKIYAYERSVDPRYNHLLQQNTNLAEMLGVWSGRQLEEIKAFELNKALIDHLADMYNKASDLEKKEQFVSIFDDQDVITKDAASIISFQARQYINSRFPDGFYVRKDMLNDAIGYRQASVGDVWTGTSRWSPATQDFVKKSLHGVFGNKAYIYANNAERFLKSTISDLRVTIVIRSVIVPMANMASNVFQLIGRGVPLTDVAKQIPRKTSEIAAYTKSRIRQMEADAELKATDDLNARRKLEAEIQSINDSHKRLSIWPLIEAGEFSSISDAGSREDILLTEGKLSEYLDAMVAKLPPYLKTAGQYAIISRDTALFRGLQKTIEYGDFIAKAVLYDDLIKRQKKTKEYALGRVTEEFVNYDRLPGRTRGYVESVGLLWFWNFKIRSAKIATSMLRNNPVHSLLAILAPQPPFISGIGLPIDDNIWSTLFDGRLDNSVGYAQAFRAPGLLPIHHIWN